VPAVHDGAGREVRAADFMLRSGVDLQTRRDGALYRRHRFSTPSGFLGVLSYGLFSHAEWLGGDGREWRIQRAGALSGTFVLLEAGQPIAAARGRGFLRRSCRIWYGAATYTVRRTGFFRRRYRMETEDDQEIAVIQGGFVDPIKRVTISGEIALPALVMACYLARKMRKEDDETT